MELANAIKKNRISMKYLVIIIIFLASCSRKVAIQQSTTAVKVDSAVTQIDTSAKAATNTTEETTNYGDTLKAVVAIPVKHLPVVDSVTNTSAATKFYPFFLESNGILINGKLTQRQDGLGFDLDIKAVAKPVSVSKKTTQNLTEKKGVATKITKQLTTNATTKNKQISKMPTWVNWFSVLSLIALIILIARSELKNKYNG